MKKDKTRIDPESARAQRMRTYEDMSPAARAAADRFAERERHQARAMMLTYYDQGAMINAAEAEAELYGPNPTRHLASFFSRPVSFYGALRTFARRFERAEVEAWAARVCPDGQPVRWQHLVEASRLVLASDRRAFLYRAVTQCWTVQELARAIDAADRPNDNFGRWDEPLKARRPRPARAANEPPSQSVPGRGAVSRPDGLPAAGA
jgi:hypothetical protein